MRKYKKSMMSSFNFTPVIVETTGGFGSDPLEFIDRLGRLKAVREKLDRLDGIKRIRQRSGIEIMRCTPAMIIQVTR